MSLPSEADEAHGHAHSSGEDMPGCDGGVFWSEQAVEDEGDGIGEDQQENVAYLRKEVGREAVFESEWPNSLANSVRCSLRLLQTSLQFLVCPYLPTGGQLIRTIGFPDIHWLKIIF